MISRHIAKLFLAAAVAMPVVPAMTVPGKAQQLQLHELLFGRNRAKRQEQQQQPTVRESPDPQPITRISGPRYYAYKADALSAVTIASLLPTPAAEQDGMGLQPSLDIEATRFAEALRVLPEASISVEKDVAKAIKAWYADHPAFVWSRGNSVTDSAKAVVKLMSAAADQGLNPADYAVDLPSDGWSMDDPVARTKELAAFDIELSARAIRYAMDIKDGVINPNKISGYHDFPLPRLTPEAALENLAKPGDATAWLDTLEPHQPEYAALKKELAKLRSETVDEIVLPETILLKPGETNTDLPQIMKALRKKVSQEVHDKNAATFAEYFDTPDYTDAIVMLVKDFQTESGLKPDGVIGRNTLGKLTDASQASKINRVELALERLRWHPEEFGARHVIINQPAFTATYFVDNQVQLSTRAIVGKKSNQTSFFFDEIETVVYNPYWGVPQSIIVNEMLSKLRSDPGYLDRSGYEVTNASGKRVSSSSVDWWSYSGKVPVSVRQKPGPSNALGDIKILFPNKHDIYMHDTPSRNLFSNEVRAYSHGCVRLQQPREMAAILLGKSVDYVSSRIGGGEQAESLPQKIPVYVAYFTAFPETDGTVDYFADIYDRDIYLNKAIDALRKARESADS